MKKTLKLSVLWLARALGLFGLSRRLTRSKLRILCYHGGNIGDERQFNPLLFCSAEHLDARVRWLKDKGFTVVPLDAAVDGLATPQARPALPVVLTFDDGWYSTYQALLPVLARHGVPSTLYLCTQYFERGNPIPPVVLNYILWKSGKSEIDLAGFGPGIDGHHVLADRPATRRLVEALVEQLYAIADPAANRALVERFAAAVGVSAAELDLGSRRFDYVTPDELARIPGLGCAIELHGHVHLYPVGVPQRLKDDLAACASVIRGQGLPEPRHYCYPSGDYDHNAHAALQEIGVRSATTCLPGLIDTATGRDVSYLPRFLDGERIHALEFEAEMSGFSDFLKRLAGRG